MDHPLVKKGAVRLRRYQESMIADAIAEPCLVVLPTGLGKTMIAAMVAAHMLTEKPDSKVLFLAPTKPLVVQHQVSLAKVLTIEDTCILTGTIPPQKRKGMWDDSTIVFATPQTIENDIIRGLDLSDVSLVIFDEAHRAMGDYSYVPIAKEYRSQNTDHYTLGLTASPSSERWKVEEICANLGLKNISAKTDSDADVKPYVQKVDIKWERVVLPDSFKAVQTWLLAAYKKCLSNLKDMGYLGTYDHKKIGKGILLKVHAQIRQEISQGMVSFKGASEVAAAIKVSHALELLETQGISALDKYIKKMKSQKSRAVTSLFADNDMLRACEGVAELKKKKIEHPKIARLANVVSGYKGKKVLVFTQYRDTVDSIIQELNAKGMTAREFIGQASKAGKKGMTQKEQLKALDAFREGKFDVLVATSVAEEGLDIPKVDAVIFYEPVPSEIRTIQRRGRTGRTDAGTVHILMAKETRDEAFYWSSYHKEKRMGKVMDDIKATGFQRPDDDPDQSKLLSFEASNPDELQIIMDSRERNSILVSELRQKAKIDITNLEVGDFIVSDRVCIERKTKADFIQSIIDGRLMPQLIEMKRNFEIPVLILEGSESLYGTQMHPNSIRGAIACAAVDMGVRIIPTEDAADTACIIISIARREQLDLSRLVPLRGGKRPQELSEMQRFVVESLPKVSSVLALRLLERFKSVEGVFAASNEDLMDIEGIGKKKAQQIRSIIESDFDS